jgi:SAM-dependent methyltransferase
MKLDFIDNELFLQTFESFSDKLKSVQYFHLENSKKESKPFFKSPVNFNQQLLNQSKVSNSVLEITDLYPVNICIIDFFLKNSIDKKLNILDFGCGIPNLLYHLYLIGYKNLYGYDNWRQIEQELAIEYVEKTNMTKNLFFNTFQDILLQKNINILCHVGCSLLRGEYNELLTKCNIEYIFADYRFTPKPDSILNEPDKPFSVFEAKTTSYGEPVVEENEITKFGFKVVAIYDGLLIIYKKIK